MATIVRVKRRRHEDPLESLVVSCKRKREEQTSAADNDINDSQSSLKFAGTVSSKVIVSFKFCSMSTKSMPIPMVINH